jgi:hypothetical protein
MKLLAEHGQHIHTCHGFALEQSGDVVAADLDARGFFYGERARLVGRLLRHGGEAEKLAVAGLIDQDLLVILVDGRDLHVAGQQDVGVLSRITDLIYALPWSEYSQVDLRGQNSNFISVEQGKERDVF